MTILSDDSRIRRLLALCAVAAGGLAAAPAASAAATPTRAGEIVVRYAGDASTTARASANRGAGVHEPSTSGPRTRVVRVRDGRSVAAALKRLRRDPDVLYAEPNVLARSSAYLPNDPGLSRQPGGWQGAQWNFMPGTGVNAPEAWTHLIAAGRSGGKGTVVAVIDSGVAYRSAGRYRASPDFASSQFVRGHDFLDNDRRPYDTSGHGTHVASTIAERTNNNVGLTGLAYGARIMPIRVLDSEGFGDVDDIARGVRYAASRGADVINLSMEFDPRIRARDIPSLMDALRFARRKGATVVAAAGNEGVNRVPYPAAADAVIAVGATTIRRCLAEYSNYGRRIDVVAPGGGADAPFTDPGCDPGAPQVPEILQLTFDGSVRRFGFPGGYQGTSMAAPHVAATAALVIASRVLGSDPSPRRILGHLQATATDLGRPGTDSRYGAGLIDAALATAPR